MRRSCGKVDGLRRTTTKFNEQVHVEAKKGEGGHCARPLPLPAQHVNVAFSWRLAIGAMLCYWLLAFGFLAGSSCFGVDRIPLE